jgi:hypothetical protein
MGDQAHPDVGVRILESAIAVAIDQILRLAPSIRPPIEPVVSSTNATSTVGFATAVDRPAAKRQQM